eukprot:1160644-Pelagomonas_calceolata.AAC.1
MGRMKLAAPPAAAPAAVLRRPLSEAVPAVQATCTAATAAGPTPMGGGKPNVNLAVVDSVSMAVVAIATEPSTNSRAISRAIYRAIYKQH